MADFNSAFFARKEDHKPKWHLIDADGMVLGRLATQVANIIRGKSKPTYTAHTDFGDYVVIVNAEKIALTGNKLNDKIYQRYSGYIGGLKEISARDLLVKHPTELIQNAVKGMLPKNKLNRQIIKKLKVYAGAEHPHKAQIGTK
jgi:large subunit ribosomal protein L13